MSYEVFVSSTRQDLIPYREAVSLRLRKAGYGVIEMEAFSARNEEPLQACLQEVVDADLFIGIYAWRYGFVPRESQISITEQELREAQRCYKPIFCFLLDEKQEWPDELRETGNGAERLAELKRRIREERICETFTTPDDLAAAVVTALQSWRDQQAQVSLSAERGGQLALLDKVGRFWIDGVLRRSVSEGRRLRVHRKELPQAVGRPAPETDEGTEEPGSGVQPIHELFAQRGGSLLILGPPGAGKTISLLELAHGLGKVARRDPNEPVPVVFNLASWKGHHQSLAGWMSEELAARYQAGKKPAAEWVEGNQILPLLDGLDEVEPGCRPACVDALNAHLTEVGLACRMAVCCHSQVYEELPGRLHLESAVALQPLTPEQVDAHLAAAGPSLAGLRAAVAADADLRELTSSPLMLTLLERTWRDLDPALSPAPEDSPVARVFEKYVERALEPQRELPWALEEKPHGWPARLPWNRSRSGAARPVSAAVRYPLERTRRSLAWLARGMAAHDPALFQLERLQPAWFETPRQLWTYAVLSRAFGGTLVVLPLAIVFELAVLPFGFVVGALLGATDIPRLRRGESPGAAGKGRLVARSAGRIGLFLGEVLLLFFLAGALWHTLGPSGLDRSQALHNLLLGGLLVGPLFGLVFGVRGAGRSGNNDVRVAEALVWRSWSWKGARVGALWGLAAGLIVWALSIRDTSLDYFGVGFFLTLSGTFSLGGSALGGALGGLDGRTLEKKAWPNQGIWLALRNAGVVALAVAGVTTVVLLAGLWSLELIGRATGEPRVFPPRDLLRTPIKVGTVLGFWVGLWYSGLDFLQHFVLRLVLRLWNLVPGRLIGFLDHATDRGLLQRPGGSYKFFHPLLLRHFTHEKPKEDAD